MLPVEMIDHFLLGGKKQSKHFMLSDIKVNGSAATYNYTRLDVPVGYEQDIPGANPALDALLGKAMPAFTLAGFDGKAFSSKALKGKVILLDFWETWCGPCIASMPKVQRLYDQYKGYGLMVVGIMNNKKNLEAATSLLVQKQISLPMFVGDEKVKADFSVSAVPLYVLVDKSGDIIFAEQGFSDGLQAAIKKALE
jgi:thiol-disulfide isomerase/thioredoxin